jgi:predicted N-acyltransferase
MPDGREQAEASVRLVKAIDEVPAEQWDACAGLDNPFLSHAFLSALEESESVCPSTGWLPQHLLYEDEAGRLVGAAPLYLKGHSHGEYVFDWGWADAYERAGGKYYPKLLSAVPFTPVTCRKLLIRPDADLVRTSEILAGGLIGVADQHAVSSLHINFSPEVEWKLLARWAFCSALHCNIIGKTEAMKLSMIS